jgi:hypothetical protein
MSHASAVGVTTGYKVGYRKIGVRVAVGPRALHIVHTGYGAQPASYTMGTGDKAVEA